jgi:cyanophycin synthetase
MALLRFAKGEWKMRITKAVNVPLNLWRSCYVYDTEHVLPAVLTGYLRGFSLQDIKLSLETFIPSAAQTPGRLNMFNFKRV